MPDPLPQSMLCPSLIGRDAQVVVLTRLLDQAGTGQGQIALPQQIGYRSGEVRARIWFALGPGPRGNYGEALAQAHAAQAIATVNPMKTTALILI